MRWYITPIFSLVLLIIPDTVQAQKQNNIWYFGRNAGIDFSTSPPTPLGNGALSTSEGSAVASNPVTGALLFYTDGVTVWNYNHQPMSNGTGLKGGPSSTQSALIVPLPGHSNIY